MLDTFKSKPSVKINRYLLLVGLFIFIPCYTYLVSLMGKMGIDTNEFNTVWLSFDQTTFTDLFQKLDQGGHLQTFVWIYQLNILSMIGFILTFFAIVGVGDIIPSLVLLSASGDMFGIAGWKVMAISGFYYFRVLILYALITWMAVVGITNLYTKFHESRTQA